MSLKLDSGPSLEVTHAILMRSMGQPVSWQFNAKLQGESWTSDETGIEGKFVHALLAGPCKASLVWDGGGALSSPFTLVAASRGWSDAWELDQSEIGPENLEIRGCATEVEAPNPFVPRRRVHRVRNLRDLVNQFDHVARPVGPLLADLAGIIFPDGAHCSIIQDDESDWDFLHHVLEHCTWLCKGKPWLPLTLVGGVDANAGTEGHWIITAGAKRAYETWSVVERLKVAPPAGAVPGERQFEFGMLDRGRRVPEFVSGEAPAVVERWPQRNVAGDNWTKWRMMDLPRFSEGGAMIHRIEDRLYVSDKMLGWDSRTHMLPPEAQVRAPTARRRWAWEGLGIVKESARTEPWIKVQLPGFEAGYDIVDARIGTVFSGKNGRRGLHMVPERDTEVALGWSGRFDQSIVVHGNVRSQAAEFASPSTYLEDEHTAQYADIHVVKVGKTAIDSDLGIHVKQRTNLASQQPLEVKADGADLKMRGSIVYTGRAG